MEDYTQSRLKRLKRKGYVFRAFGQHIIVLKIPDDALTAPVVDEVKDPEYATYKANKLEVFKIINKHYGEDERTITDTVSKSHIVYTIGDMIGSDDNWVRYIKSFDRAFYIGILKNYTTRWCSWHDNGIMAELYEYAYNKMDARWIKWFDNGHIRSTGFIKNGLHNGEMLSFHPNSTKRMSCSYVKGKITGPATFWHDNGTKYEEGEFKNDLRTGEWTEWDSDGNVVQVKTHK
jgi:antitoxin component YwqK of YwqJK toxin-antitoxin module